MKKELAEKVLAEVSKKFDAASYPEDSRPRLFPGEHEELDEDAWVVSWEEGPYEWAMSAWPSEVPGVFVEPIYSWCLGVFED